MSGDKIMKIGIVTIHTDFNYGAVLQAVATQKFLESQGYDAEIIDYENAAIASQSKIAYKQDGKLKGYAITFLRNTLWGRYFFYKEAVRDLDIYRIKSRAKYKSIEELEKSSYDVLIAGSDQIWNPAISRGIDPVFLLGFGKEAKRVSIATSMGSHTLNDAEKKVFIDALSDFSNISVREEFARDQLQPLVNKNIKVVLDPTLLLSKEIWWDFLGSKSKYATPKEKYILTYFVGGDKSKYRPMVAEYANQLGLPVWTIQYSNYTWKESSKKILGASIVDFVALIANAELVITDSFHGVAFSVNMGTDFVAATNTANPVRVKEFLEKVGLENRIDMKAKEYSHIKYDSAIAKLETIRNESKEWILKALDE